MIQNTPTIGHWRVRSNFADSSSIIQYRNGAPYPYQQGIGSRYRNFLKTQALNRSNDPEHRHLVCEFDPIMFRLTHGYVKRALNRPISFYTDLEDDLYGFGKKIPESSKLYARIKQIGLIEHWKVAIPKMLIDGYQMTKPEISLDELGNVREIDFEKCYSDYEIHQLIKNNYGQECFRRADQSFLMEHPELPIKYNDIIEVNINFLPRLPANRGRGRLLQVHEKWQFGEYIHTYHQTKNHGLGEPYVIPIWDACTKLLEVSENNHFRQDLFFLVELPAYYFNNGDLADEFMRSLVYARENNQGFAYSKEIDKEDRVTNIPNIMNQNMVRDSQPTRATTTGVGALTDSDWSRITAATGYSISYFMGDPAGAVEAGQVDKMADVQVDIERFAELTEEIIIPELKWLTEIGVFSDILPLDFNWDLVRIKTHWEIDKENRQMALFEASHMASGGGNPSNFKSGNEADTGTGSPKMPSEKQNSYLYMELVNSRINEVVQKRASQTGLGKQKAESGPAKKVKRDIGKTKHIGERGCVAAVKAQLKRKNPDKDPQQLERQAKKICKAQKTKKPSSQKEKPVDVHGYNRSGKEKVKGHDRGMPKYTQHKVGVKSYTRGGKKISGYTRYPQSKRKNDDDIYWCNGYMISNYNVQVTNYGDRLNVEYNESGWENDGEVEYIDLDDLVMLKYISLDEEKTRSLLKFFKDNPRKSPKDLPPLIVDNGGNILDGNHRAFVYKTLYLTYNVPVQFVKQKEVEGLQQPYTLVDSIRNAVMPLLPVGSSMVKGIGLKDDELIVQFHKSGKQVGSGSTYGYKFDSDGDAKQAYDDMLKSSSQGGFVWDRLRGSDIGPAWGTGNPTPGGTSASIVPYEKHGRSPVQTWSGDYQRYQKEAKDLQKIKMETKDYEGEELGKRRMYNPEQLGEQKFDPTSQFYREPKGWGFPFNKPTVMYNPGQSTPLQEPYSKKPKKGGEGSVGRPTKGVPYYKQREMVMKTAPAEIHDAVMKAKQVKTNIAESLHFQKVDNSDEFYGIPFEGTAYDVPDELRLNDYDYWFESKNKALEVLGGSKSRFYEENQPFEAIRYNKFKADFDKEDDEYYYAIVNGFSTTNRFQYWVNNRVQVEFQCPDDIKRQIGLEVPLGVYHNKDIENDVTLPEWQIVGTYKVLAYDDEDETDVSSIKINKKRVKEVFERLNEDDWITPILESGKCPDISTSYKAMVKWNSKLKVWVQTGFKLESVAIVPKGNCSAPFCTGDLIRENGKIRDLIMNKITKIGKSYKEKGKKLNVDEIIDLALIEDDEKEDENEDEEILED